LLLILFPTLSLQLPLLLLMLLLQPIVIAVGVVAAASRHGDGDDDDGVGWIWRLEIGGRAADRVAVVGTRGSMIDQHVEDIKILWARKRKIWKDT